MPGELLRPGVEVLQTIRSASPTFVRPTLVPCVVGPAFEVINVLDSDGAVNSKALQGDYLQLGSTITQSSFPDPRDNLDELDIQEDTIKPYLLANGTLSELLMSPGEAFLAASHGASKAVMKTAIFSGGTGLALDGKTITIALNQPTRADTSEDIVITFEGTGNLLSDDVAEQINEAVGKAVATVVGEAPNDRVQIASDIYGALSSITVRRGGSANELLELGIDPADATDTAHEQRVEGAGFRAQDDSDSDTVSPWIEFYRGAYMYDGTDTAIVPATMGWINILTGTFSATKASAVTFGSSGSFPLEAGDYVYADGTRVKSGEIMKVESTRFKMGTIDTARSEADDDGVYTTKVYNVAEVGTILDTNAFAPKYVWFKACGLESDDVAPAAATVTGSQTGIAAAAGYVTGSADISSGVSLAGLTLLLTVEVDGEETEVTYTFTGGPFADASAVATAIGTDIDGVTASASGAYLRLSTSSTGSDQAVSVKISGTANTALGFSTSSVTTGRGTDIEFPAILDTSANTFPTTTLTGKVMSLEWTTDGTTYTAVNYTFAGEMASAAAVATALNADATWSAEFGALDLGGTLVRIYSKRAGADVRFRVKATTNTCEGVGNLSGFPADSTVSRYSLNGSTLKFTMNSNSHIYEVPFASNSLVDAVAEVNEIVGGDVASVSSSSMLLTSTLEGLGSKIAVTALSEAETVLGLSTTEATGSGRPYPDAYLDDTNSLVLGSEILRDQITGYPLDQSAVVGKLYVQFKGLRRDVSPLAAVAGVLKLSDQATLASTLDPLTEDNPLGLATYLMMINAPGLQVKALGVDDVSAAAPEGTEAAYARAAEMLQAEEVYAIAPLTQNEVVHQMWGTHVTAMSEPEQGGERIVFLSKVTPTRENSAVAASGTQANSTASENQLLLDASPAAGLAAAGVSSLSGLTYDDGVYIEVTVDDEFRRYLVTTVSGALVTLSTDFEDDENEDGFFTTTDLDEDVVNAAWSLKVLGDSLIVPGSNPERYDYQTMAETVAGASESIANRRVFNVFPDTIKTTVEGVEKSLPGYYAAACVAGMVASQPPQQGFTNFPITGLTGVTGTEKFTKRQLDYIAGGGTYILIQDTPGAAVSCRHQLSTDLTSIETRELSITKVVDFTAKFLRGAVRKFIGTSVINSQFLDTVGATITGVLQFLKDAGVLLGFSINNLVQDTENPDTLLVDVTLEVPFPCNYIKITLVV